MATWIACLVAGVCTMGFITLWFSTAYRELSEKRGNLDGLWEQLQLHQSASVQAGSGPGREVALNMLSTNRTIFRGAVSNYNRAVEEARESSACPAAGLPSGYRERDCKAGGNIEIGREESRCEKCSRRLRASENTTS